MKVATAMIDCAALRHNLTSIQAITHGAQVMVIVKGNAYGHGDVTVARILEPQADFFGVARLSEAITLRQAGIQKPIVLLEGFFTQAELPFLAEYQLSTVIHSLEQIEMLERTTLAQPLSVWMKIDTGMHRLGIRLEQCQDYYERLLENPQIVQPINLMTHLCCSDMPHSSFTCEQLTLFKQFIEGKPGLRSVAASGGILHWPASHYDVVRSGIALYGISPLPNRVAADLNLKPVMTLQSNLIAVRYHAKGEPVGYGATWYSEQETYLGVVAMGYADGYPQQMRQGTPVLIGGRLVPLVGRVSMDMLVVDLGMNPTDKVGDRATLWGEGLPVEVIAEFNQISVYELVTRLTKRTTLEYYNLR